MSAEVLLLALENVHHTVGRVTEEVRYWLVAMSGGKPTQSQEPSYQFYKFETFCFDLLTSTEQKINKSLPFKSSSLAQNHLLIDFQQVITTCDTQLVFQ